VVENRLATRSIERNDSLGVTDGLAQHAGKGQHSESTAHAA
jgi:hypothetical protein